MYARKKVCTLAVKILDPKTEKFSLRYFRDVFFFIRFTNRLHCTSRTNFLPEVKFISRPCLFTSPSTNRGKVNSAADEGLNILSSDKIVAIT